MVFLTNGCLDTTHFSSKKSLLVHLKSLTPTLAGELLLRVLQILTCANSRQRAHTLLPTAPVYSQTLLQYTTTEIRSPCVTMAIWSLISCSFILSPGQYWTKKRGVYLRDASSKCSVPLTLASHSVRWDIPITRGRQEPDSAWKRRFLPELTPAGEITLTPRCLHLNLFSPPLALLYGNSWKVV